MVYGGICLQVVVWWCMVVYGGVIIQVLDSCGGIGVTAPLASSKVVQELEVEGDVSCVCGGVGGTHLNFFYLLPIFSIATVRNMFLKVKNHSDSVMRTLTTNHITISHFRFNFSLFLI